MSKSMSVKINDQYQITLPSYVCEEFNIQVGDHLLMDMQGGLLILIPQPTDYVAHMAGLHAEIWQNIDTKAYLDEERDW